MLCCGVAERDRLDVAVILAAVAVVANNDVVFNIVAVFVVNNKDSIGKNVTKPHLLTLPRVGEVADVAGVAVATTLTPLAALATLYAP